MPVRLEIPVEMKHCEQKYYDDGNTSCQCTTVSATQLPEDITEHLHRNIGSKFAPVPVP
jgi:hypothetical protein